MAQKKKKGETQSKPSGPSRAAMQWILLAFMIGLALGSVIGYNVGRGASAGDRGPGKIGTDGALDTSITRTIIPDLAPLMSVSSLWERYCRLPPSWLAHRFSPTASSNGVLQLRGQTG